MQEIRRWPAAWLPLVLIALTIQPVAAGDDDGPAAGGHLLQAELALQSGDYLQAAVEYRRAAQLSDNPELARQATKVGMAFRFDQEALLAARRWLRLEPDNDEARLHVAQASLHVGDQRAARRHYRQLIEKSPDSPGESLLRLSSHLADEVEVEEADKLLRALAKPYGSSALAQLAVANLALQAGDAGHAIDRVLRAIELEPDNLQARLLYGRALLVNGEVDRAIDHTARIIGDDPDPDPDARMELALMYMLTERDEDALSQVNQVLLEQSGRSDALRLMAIINFRLGHLDAAWEDFHDLLDTGHFRMDALYYLGRISDYRGEYDRAVRFYGQVTQGSNAVTSQRRAGALLAHEFGDVDGALRQLSAYAASSPADAVDMVFARAVLLASVERYEQALAEYDRAIRFRPEDEDAFLGRTEVLVRMGRVDEALREYARAIRRWPKSALTLNAYGYTLADRTNRYREAEKLIRKAIRYDAENPAIIDSLGWVLHKRGRHAEALAELERAYASLPDHEVAAHIVEVLVALGREEEALQRLVLAEAETPESPLLLDVRQRLFPESP